MPTVESRTSRAGPWPPACTASFSTSPRTSTPAGGRRRSSSASRSSSRPRRPIGTTMCLCSCRPMPARRTEVASAIIRGGTVVTMDPLRTVAAFDLLVDAEGRISGLLEPGSKAQAETVIDASGMVVVPGLVQAHLHVCQTLFRGLAEQRPLLAWLRERIWPLEAAHDPASLHASARLGIAELLLGGTTAILDMGTVHHTDALFEAAAETGIRYTGGKAMMDAGDSVPARLLEPTSVALRDS